MHINKRRQHIHRSLIALGVGAALVATITISSAVEANGGKARTTFVDAAGDEIGAVKFHTDRDGTDVKVTLRAGNSFATAFHGFHIHANTDGAACAADATQPASTWFTAVGGHWKAGSQTHGQHLGDLPSLFVNADGSATARFTIDKIAVADLAGKAVIVHAGADNFGNIPQGAALDQYTANDAVAVTKTQNTGNAGDRIACGVIR